MLRAAFVAVAYSAHGAAAEKTAAQAAEDGVQAMAVGADLRRPQAPAELVNAVERALGPVDVLVANAGTGRTRSWEAVSSADFDEATAVNLRAPFLLAQRTLPGMQERRFGRILFISSVAAFTGGLIGPQLGLAKRRSCLTARARAGSQLAATAAASSVSAACCAGRGRCSWPGAVVSADAGRVLLSPARSSVAWCSDRPASA